MTPDGVHDTRICHICGATVPRHESCPTCTAAIPAWKSPALMTREERLAEFMILYGPLEVPFEIWHERLEALIGRRVWTHELARPDLLMAEIIGEREAPTIEQITEILVQRVGAERVVVLDLDGGLARKVRRQ